MRRCVLSMGLFAVCLLPLVTRVYGTDPPCSNISGGLRTVAVPKSWYEKHGAKSGDPTDPAVTACNMITIGDNVIPPGSEAYWKSRCNAYTIYTRSIVLDQVTLNSMSPTSAKPATNADGSHATVVCKQLYLCDTENIGTDMMPAYRCKTRTGYPVSFKVEYLVQASPCTK